MELEDTKTFARWCILEQQGYKKLAGFVHEVTVAGCGFLQIDVPGEGANVKLSQLVHPSTIYCLTPVSEEIARKIAAQSDPRPMAILSLEYAHAPDFQEETRTRALCQRCEHPAVRHEDTGEGHCLIPVCACLAFVDGDHDFDEVDEP